MTEETKTIGAMKRESDCGKKKTQQKRPMKKLRATMAPSGAKKTQTANDTQEKEYNRNGEKKK